MSRLSEEIEARLEDIRKKILFLEHSLRKAPDGRLRVSMNGRNPRFYHMTRKGDVTGKYIRRDDIRAAERLAQKDYDQDALELLKKEERLLSKMEKYYEESARKSSKKGRFLKGNVSDCFSGPEELLLEQGAQIRRTLVVPIAEDTETFVREWLSESFEKKEFLYDDTEYITGNGIRVRSKTEFIIAEMLEKRGIPFYYEKPLELRGLGTVYPDFTVLNTKSRQTYYWEHMGMMDDELYLARALEKINCYMMNGHFPGIDLILTHETQARPVRTQILEKTIETYLES